jgi:hypothetical protein
MAFTYSGDPSASSRDAVRFLLGDTTESNAQLSDAEIEWLLTKNTNVFFAAALAADKIGAKYTVSSGGGSGVKTKTVGALSISYETAKEKAEEYRKMSSQLRVQGALTSSWQAYSGGISKSDKRSRESDTDWDRPSFSRGMHDYPGSDYTGRSTST